MYLSYLLAIYLNYHFITPFKAYFLIPGKPLSVFVGFQVLDIGEVNEETMVNYCYDILLYFHSILCNKNTYKNFTLHLNSCKNPSSILIY